MKFVFANIKLQSRMQYWNAYNKCSTSTFKWEILLKIDFHKVKKTSIFLCLVLIKENYLQLEYIITGTSLKRTFRVDKLSISQLKFEITGYVTNNAQECIPTVWVISIILFQHEKSCKEISYEY